MNSTTIKSLLKLEGRINRTEFFAYLFLLQITFFLITLPTHYMPDDIFNELNIITQIIFAILMFLLAIGRVHDYNESILYALLFFVPLINLFIIFAKGEPFPNKYGPPRPSPTVLTKLLAISFILVPTVMLIILSLSPELAESIKS